MQAWRGQLQSADRPRRLLLPTHTCLLPSPMLLLQEDVVGAMLATACLACFLQPTTYCTFRDQPVLDGGYAASWEQLCPGGGECAQGRRPWWAFLRSVAWMHA